MRENEFYDILVPWMILGNSGRSVHPEIQPVHVSSFFIVAEIKTGTPVLQRLVGKGGLVILVRVGPAMYPDEAKCIGRVVGILHLHKTIECMLYIVQGYVDRIIHLLLPVGRLATDHK